MLPRVSATVRRHPAATVGVMLLGVYLATLAPSVTLWDSGEFLAAVRTLGIPHPPGTPLFIYLARAWSLALAPLDFTVAVNAGSAVASALGIALLVQVFVARAGVGPTVSAGLVAGLVSAVWQSATETEVYAWALCLGAVMVWVGDQAGRSWSSRHRALLAFCFGLAVPLHISALVAGPAAVLLAATDSGGSLSLRASLAPLAAWLVAVGIGVTSPLVIAVGGAFALVSIALAAGGQDSRRLDGILAVMLSVLGATFVLVMLVRAAHDPAVNQGNPVTWQSLLDVIGRTQYDVPPFWPRRAPLWLQLGNLIQYADWQFALGVDDAPGPSLLRTPVTIAFAGLGIRGAVAHRARDARGFRALGLLCVAASIGVVGMLNLRAGPSYGWGVLPDGAPREARERDYFFALAFACWGLWAGTGIAAFARDASRRWIAAFVSATAVLPLLLNWASTNRRRHPDAQLAAALGIESLRAAPPNAVLILAGDNDSYAAWWAQHVRGVRPDITPVTVPLLPADWYRAELARRARLLDSASAGRWRGTTVTLQQMAAAAAREGRPLAVAVGVSRSERLSMGSGWRFLGLVYVREPAAQDQSVDRSAAVRSASALRSLGVSSDTRALRDGTGRYVMRLLQCPEVAVAQAPGQRGGGGLLETTCNY
ncbi:MAG: DUF2723 domain-containing protein [Gemmatimonadaceae bacterium]|nr:DUF2723 domain-containing protein [Gemmatimonadaceae bacterium]